MTRKEFIELIVEIESEYDTSLLKVNGINFWPLMRRSLFTLFFSTYTDSSSSDTSGKRLKRYLSYLLTLAVYPLQLIKLSILKKSKVEMDVLFTGDKSQHLIHDGISVNRFLYPFRLYNKQHIITDSYLNTREMILPVDQYNLNVKSFILFELLRFKFKKIALQSDTQELMSAIIERVSKDAKIDLLRAKSIVLSSLKNTLASNIFFTKLLPIIGVKKVLSVSYYGTEIYGLFAACKNLSIPTVDIQHGGQGNLHLAYSNFTKIPLEGYHMLPKYFWVWNLESANEINTWSQNQKYHSVITGGQPWLSSQLSGKFNKKHRNRNILYTMQFPSLGEFELSLMSQTAKNFLWYLKPHPIWENELDELKEKIAALPYADKIQLLPPGASLVKYLYQSDIHISKYSGSIIEANLLGVYSIIIDPIGISTFQDLIEKGSAFRFTDQDSNFLSLTENILELPSLPISVLDLDEICSLYNSIE
jgi:hypothetical protein